MKKLIKIFGIILLSNGAVFTLTACDNQHKTDPLQVNNKAHHLSNQPEDTRFYIG